MINPNNAGMPGGSLPDPPKAVDWLRHLPGLLPAGAVVAVIVIIGLIVPPILRKGAADDLHGVPEQTSAGIVRTLLDDPGHFGGGAVFNAVVIEFAGHKVFWDLPPTSRWKPMINEIVEVRYRVGRTGAHQVKVDNVLWGTSMDRQFRQP